ncbi:YifB family Mg chelatase-like AAA ATPase [Candidatus Hydrogenosomobacter endosymbioticus]|uniref:ATPase AAA n=1 Tax=Candidatus Hydrogenosomobacter endosymbioticus TaxID=2558174 RepID=A0ABM7V9B5_9PROT|nr:YifB family Mg chelatase-like AAA ATPase [Candidatus Hydrogenosomobacter endosymbioticus]BDB96379.1 ATPase AAA [Candidatus Hydrogenosomobacter endosymbioticus]
MQTVCFQGIEAVPIDVQIMISPGLPSFSVVGLPDKAVSESRERIKAALHAIGIALPSKKITVNLSPANIKKEGSHYDLPIALCLLSSLGAVDSDLSRYIAIGELSLDGRIVPVHGVLSTALRALESEKGLICPYECGGEAVWAGNLEVIASKHIIEIANHFKGAQVLSAPAREAESLISFDKDFSDVKGQNIAKRALEIAAAGGHNVLMIGQPGIGKSMLAARMQTILPPLTARESLEVTMINSVAQVGAIGRLARKRPFRSPHHSASTVSMIGGGIYAVPGEVSLAHGGILFLDELAEFSRGAMEALRQPMESGEAIISRANAHISYPARFQLIAAMNPCRCGYFGDKEKQCRQSPECADQYKRKLSGPFLDRIDISIDIFQTKNALISSIGKEEKSDVIRSRVIAARAIQQRRYGVPDSLEFLNANISDSEFRGKSECSDDAMRILAKATEKLSLSMRAHSRLLRVARTIADIEGCEQILKAHMAEALGYRGHRW